MSSIKVPTELDQNGLAFLRMGRNSKMLGQTHTKRCLSLLTFLGRSSPLFDTLRVEMERLSQVDVSDDFSLPHTPQPLVKDAKGRVRFQPNELFRNIVQQGPWAHAPFLPQFSNGDREQVAQLLGLEREVFQTLPFVRKYQAASVSQCPIREQGGSQPNQGMALDEEGYLAFRANKLVKFLVEQSDVDLASIEASFGDKRQISQLLGEQIGNHQTAKR